MIQTKQTLKHRIATGMIWLGGLASLAGLSGCATREYRNSQGCWKFNDGKGTIYYSQNCDGNWQYMGLSKDWYWGKNGNLEKETPEQIKAWYDYMERAKQKKEQEAKAEMDYMRRKADRLNSQQIIILQKPDQQPNLEKNIEEAATRGTGNFIGEVLIREYLK